MRDRAQSVGSNDRADHQRFSKQLADSRRKQRGCCIVILAVPVIVVVGGVIAAKRDIQAWHAAKPPKLAEGACENKRSRCETVNIGPAACAAVPEAHLSRALGKRRAEFCNEDVEAEAISHAEIAARGSLKAPVTSKFGGEQATHRGCEWRVTGTVDAENSFGALLRNRYQVDLLRVARDVWAPTSVKIE